MKVVKMSHKEALTCGRLCLGVQDNVLQGDSDTKGQALQLCTIPPLKTKSALQLLSCSMVQIIKLPPWLPPRSFMPAKVIETDPADPRHLNTHVDLVADLITVVMHMKIWATCGEHDGLCRGNGWTLELEMLPVQA